MCGIRGSRRTLIIFCGGKQTKNKCERFANQVLSIHKAVMKCLIRQVRVGLAADAAEGRVCPQKLFCRVLNSRIPSYRWILSKNP